MSRTATFWLVALAWLALFFFTGCETAGRAAKFARDNYNVSLSAGYQVTPESELRLQVYSSDGKTSVR